MKSFKRVLGIFITAAVIGGIIFTVLNQNKVVSNTPGASGNIAGNLYNEGVFCEDEERIYFSNPLDQGSLYSMSHQLDDFKKILSDNVRYINVTNAYLVYGKSNNKGNNSGYLGNFHTVGLYRVNKKNSRNMVMLYSEPTGLVNLYENTVYYQHYNAKTGLQLYSVSLGKKDETQLSDEALIPGSIQDNILYYAGVGSDHNIYALNLKTQDSQVIYQGNCYMPLAFEDFLYFLSVDDNYGIMRMPLEGGEPELLVSERCSSYNLSINGKYLYYQVDDGTNNRLCCFDQTTMDSWEIASGNFNHLSVTSDYLFYQEFGGTTLYYISSNGQGQPQIFTPPILK